MRAFLEDEARALLGACKIGRLGCVDGGEPHVVPINYVFEDGFQTTCGPRAVVGPVLVRTTCVSGWVS